MSFGLKNIGATYQRVMVTLFHDMMHKEVEVYVDDIIAKSKEGDNHVAVLQKLFERLRKYQMKLNPDKCTFGAYLGNMLGFIVGREGIRVDPKKVEAIQEMPAQKTEKETPGRPLILYMTLLQTSMGAMLGQYGKTGKKEQAIYYLSKKFNECKSRYATIERTCCALVWASKRLRQYMLYYTTSIVSRMDPLRYTFESPHVSLRREKWQMMLSEFDVKYVTQKYVKGRAIADQLAESPIDGEHETHNEFPDGGIYGIDEQEEDIWEMYFDGAVNMHGNGVGAVIISPVGKQYPVAIKLDFECTNNIVEYEECINDLLFACELNVKKLRVFGDSTLIIYQVNGEWQTKNTKLIPYQKYLSFLAKKFEEICFSHVTRDKNQFANALATLAVMTKLEVHANVRPVRVIPQDEPSYCCANIVADGEPWSCVKVFLIIFFNKNNVK
ncbi:PREDICTED: uncharacterized protein LOC109335473 [Lupinus angustifolius]|uniref:uncharacterized protein LOC109335473 n=1 Tax=Lupinus angustifolius TaxID=3871 RepID=UPI00092FABC1|nr:PREDICTED: uncharacterized protein LOC109335473 [Lupinus angustifolius]